MKNILSISIAVILMAGCLTACSARADSKAGSDTNSGSASQRADSISIVTTIFPEYDWVQNILGDNPAGADVTMLLDNGVDLHSYQPTADDIMKISGCDLFIYVGGESDEWVEDALREATNENMIVVNLLESLGEQAKEEELAPGMEPEDEEPGTDEDEEEGPEYDEHVWLSLRNASYLADVISDAIQNIDPDNADTYKKNTEAYTAELAGLDEEYQAAVSEAELTTLLFGDRFPFRYLVDDYGLSYYAAFSGCSAETEASFETITFLAQKVDELSLHAVMTIEGTDHRIAETIISNTQDKDQQILTMDSMQSATPADVQNGVNYLSIMESNLSVLREALK